MKYYKIKQGSSVLGIGDSGCLLCYQVKHNVWLHTDEDHAEVILPYGLEVLYHDYWMRQSDKSVEVAEDAEVIEITKQEFDDLYDQIIIQDEPVEEPEPPVEEPIEEESEELPFTMGDLLECLADLEMRVCLLEMGVNVNDNV